MQSPKKPVANLPHPLAHYGFPESQEVLLPWSFVSERVDAAKNYWVCTIGANGDPHARPVWGVWVDDRLFFGGRPAYALVPQCEGQPAPDSSSGRRQPGHHL